MDESLESRSLCGTIFLTDSGCLIYECSLCDKEYECHNDYWTHVMNEHYLSRPDVVFSADDLKEMEDSDYEELVEEPTTSSMEAVDAGESIIEFEEIVNSNGNADDIEQQTDQGDDYEELIEEEPPKNIGSIDEIIKRAMSEADVSPASAAKPPLPPVKCSSLIRQSLIRQAKHLKCPKCDKVFKGMVRLRVHLTRHLGILRHRCELCDRGFIGKNEYDLHMRRHRNERPFLCFECGERFFSSSALTEHIKRRHRETRDYQCTECSWKFKTSTRLKNHMVKHTKEKNHVCPICDARFPRRTSLVCHIKLHENKRAYACKLCSASFNQKPGLYSHMKSKHKTVQPTDNANKALLSELEASQDEATLI